MIAVNTVTDMNADINEVTGSAIARPRMVTSTQITFQTDMTRTASDFTMGSTLDTIEVIETDAIDDRAIITGGEGCV